MTLNGLWVSAGQVVALTNAYKGTVHRHTLVQNIPKHLPKTRLETTRLSDIREGNQQNITRFP